MKISFKRYWYIFVYHFFFKSKINMIVYLLYLWYNIVPYRVLFPDNDTRTLVPLFHQLPVWGPAVYWWPGPDSRVSVSRPVRCLRSWRWRGWGTGHWGPYSRGCPQSGGWSQGNPPLTAVWWPSGSRTSDVDPNLKVIKQDVSTGKVTLCKLLNDH